MGEGEADPPVAGLVGVPVAGLLEVVTVPAEPVPDDAPVVWVELAAPLNGTVFVVVAVPLTLMPAMQESQYESASGLNEEATYRSYTR